MTSDSFPTDETNRLQNRRLRIYALAGLAIFVLCFAIIHFGRIGSEIYPPTETEVVVANWLLDNGFKSEWAERVRRREKDWSFIKANERDTP